LKKKTDVQTEKKYQYPFTYSSEKNTVLLILYFLLTDLNTPSATSFNFVQENTLLQTVTWNNL